MEKGHLKTPRKGANRCQALRLCSALLAALLFAALLPVRPVCADSPYPQWQVIDGSGKTRTCTGYVWSEANRRFGINMAGLGHARNWLNAARIQGYATGSVPRPNSIAVWEPYALRDLGHVAYVTAVFGNGKMQVNHAGITNRYGRPIGNQGILYGTVVQSTLGSAPFKGNDLHLVGFIYLTSRAAPSVTLIADVDKSSVGHTGATVTAQLSKGAKEKVENCSCLLRKRGAKTGWEKQVELPEKGVGQGIFFLTCSPEKDWQEKLLPNTEYEVQFFAVVGGKKIKSAPYHFRTSPYHRFGPWKVEKEPTCTQQGELRSSCSCGKFFVQKLPKKEHWVGDYALKQAPTCTRKGMLLKKCGLCFRGEPKELPLTPHVFEPGWVRSEKVHYHVCACGATKDFGPHQWAEKQLANGEKAEVCIVCGARKEPPAPSEREAKALPIWPILAGILGGLALAGAGFFFLLRRKKRAARQQM